VTFRFVCCLVVLWAEPFPLGLLPWTDWASRWNDRLWNPLIIWCGRLCLHRTVDVTSNGSGDTSAGWMGLALLVALSLVATLVWSLLDRRRLEYGRGLRWLRVYLRFFVGSIMIYYGLAKVFHSQFPFPTVARLEEPYGDSSPMGLLWAFMGYSTPYNVFTGLAETVPAVLLFFRRTATLGALLLVGVLTNVVMLNFCYDVPVKIGSTELLLASLYIAGPRLRPLFAALMGRAVAADAEPPPFTRRHLIWAGRVATIAFAAWVLIHDGTTIRGRARARVPSGGLTGLWLVDTEMRDGAVVGADDLTHLARLDITAYKDWMRAAYRRVDGRYDRLAFKIDSAKKRLTIDPDPAQPTGVWSYGQPDADHLTLSGPLDGHQRVLTLRRNPYTHDYLLVTRGFHFINEAPYDR